MEVQGSKTKASIQNDNQPADRQLVTLFDVDDPVWKDFEKAAEFLDFIREPQENGLNVNDTQVKCRALPFYNDIEMISITNLYPPEIPEDEFYSAFLKKGEDHIVMLDGQSIYIQEMNETGALDLTKDNVFDYLKFFCAYLIDDEYFEPYLVIEGPQSEFLADASQLVQSRILRNYGGPRLLSSTDNRNFIAETRLIHAGTIYDAKFKITQDGNVIMTDDIVFGAI